MCKGGNSDTSEGTWLGGECGGAGQPRVEIDNLCVCEGFVCAHVCAFLCSVSVTCEHVEARG